MSKTIEINSFKGSYKVDFKNNAFSKLINNVKGENIFIIDKNVGEIYSKDLNQIISQKKHLIIDANEGNKSLEKFPAYIKELVNLEVTRDHTLVAIGGGIIQDITCFIASTLMRGVSWTFFPTTLLAQADSCIGSKSSINSDELKNILGTFNPPQNIVLDVSFLKTLKKDEINSGVGEMIKVHAIDAPSSFNDISGKYEDLLASDDLMEYYIYQSLMMKKKLIEVDEFDQNKRNVMNYGHSFGHAIETATQYTIPHGIAVTIGMDMANYVAVKLGQTNESNFNRMHSVLDKNALNYRGHEIDHELLLAALLKDKKNTKDKLRLILPNREGLIEIGLYDKSPDLIGFIKEYLEKYQV